MIRTPKGMAPLLRCLTGSFRRNETARRLIFFCAAAILVIGTRTVSNVMRLLSLIEKLIPSTHHRLFSRRRWSAWNPSRGPSRPGCPLSSLYRCRLGLRRPAGTNVSLGVPIVAWKGIRHVFRHDRRCPTRSVDRMGFSTGAARQCCSHTICPIAPRAGLWPPASRINWKTSSCVKLGWTLSYRVNRIASWYAEHRTNHTSRTAVCRACESADRA